MARIGASLILVLIVMGSTTPVAAQPDPSDARITNVTYTGDGTVQGQPDDMLLWRSKSHEFTVKIYTKAQLSARMCLRVNRVTRASDDKLACQGITAPANRFVTAVLHLDAWPSGVSGSQNLSVTLTANNGSIGLAQRDLVAIIIRPTGDLDGDGLTNQDELTRSTDLQASDSDDDGLSDNLEVTTYGTSPHLEDSDEDGVSDSAEVRSHGTDPLSPDTDDDGLTDQRELRVGSNPLKADTDGDGQWDGSEVNVFQTDPTDPDTDNDGLDDRTEITEHQTNPLQADTDGDGLVDNLEITTYHTDPTMVDSDSDGLQDGVEIEEYQSDPSLSDSDHDGLPDGQEVNTYGTNPTEPDSDGDGLSDGEELNRFGTNPNRMDTDNDGTSDSVEVQSSAFDRFDTSSYLLIGIVIFVGVIGVVLYRRQDVVPRFDRPRPAKPEAKSPADQEVTPAAQGPVNEESIPPEFLSNEDCILSLLADHEGKVEQATIVEETGWSKSKVSRVLSQMEDDELIVKIDVGRGNLVTDPELVPEGVMTPFEK